MMQQSLIRGYICGTALPASAFFRRFTTREWCGHMYGLLMRP